MLGLLGATVVKDLMIVCGISLIASISKNIRLRFKEGGR